MSRLNAAWFDFDERGQAWDHFWQDAATVSGDATVSGAGQIATAEAFGSGAVLLTVVEAGISTAESFGSIDLAAAITVAGIASSELFGDPDVSEPGSGAIVECAGIVSAEAFGLPLIEDGTIHPSTGGGGGSIFGRWQRPKKRPAKAKWVDVTGIVSSEEFGEPEISEQVADTEFTDLFLLLA